MRPLLLSASATLLVCSLAFGAEIDDHAEYRGRPAIVVSTDELELTVLPLGGPLASLVRAGETDPVNPLWDSYRQDVESGRPIRGTGAVGHFLCLDGFGPVSEEEAAAGLNGHGEAHRLPWSTVSAETSNGEARLVQAVQLPRVHEVYERTISMRDGERVIKVSARLSSLLSFDHPVIWAEHGTIGSPFLEPGQTVVDMSANRAITRPRPKPASGRTHRLVADTEFEWPMAPTQAGGKVDLRAAPVDHDSLDHTGHLMTPGGEYAWVTALHPGKNLLLGYLFKTSEFPWLQTWESYPAEGLLARGLEFGASIFDRPRRDIITQNSLFGELIYRWLPALSTIESSFLVFWTETPDAFDGVSTVELSGGKLTITDARSGQKLVLPTRQTLR